MTGKMDFDFSGSTAFIFGGAGGIPREIARAIGTRGGKIFLFDVNETALAAAEKGLTDLGISVRTYRTDITDEASVTGSVNKAMKEAGHVDILINGASIITRKSVFDLTFPEWLRAMSINLNGTVLASMVVGGIMLKQGYGRIMNFSSQNASGALHNADYSASKAGIESFTRSLAVEFRERNVDVTVNAVSPPPTITDLWKKGRTEEQIAQALERGSVFQPDEMLGTIMFLCSKESGSISGQVLSHRANLFRVPNR